MAEQVNLKLPYVLRQNRSSNPKMTGKYYARVYSKGLLDTRGLAEHMVEHGLVRNAGRVYSVLSKLSECLTLKNVESKTTFKDGQNRRISFVGITGACPEA